MLKKSLLILSVFTVFPWNTAQAALPECITLYEGLRSMNERNAEHRAKLVSNLIRLLEIQKAPSSAITNAELFYISNKKPISEILKTNLEPELKKILQSTQTSVIINSIIRQEELILKEEESFAESCIVNS